MKEVENDLIKYWVEDGILYSQFKKETVMTIENVQTAIELRHKISDNKKQYWCVDFENLKSYPSKSLKYAEIHGQDHLHACAVLVRSHVAFFIFNSFSLFKKVNIPFRAFTKREKAIQWLKKLEKVQEN